MHKIAPPLIHPQHETAGQARAQPFIWIGLMQLAGRNPHIWRTIGQNTLYMAAGMTQSGLHCVTPNGLQAFLRRVVKKKEVK
jgi:hypothetical protein